MNQIILTHRRTVRLLVTALALAGLAGLSLLSARPAAASGSGFHFGKWLVDLSFPDNKPLVELTTEIWYKPPNGPAYLVTSETEALPCTVTGNLPINNEIAQFTGQASIACDQPDMVQKFFDVSNGVLNNVPYLVPVRNAYVMGQVTILANAPANMALPVHDHPSLRHALARKASGDAVQYFQVGGQMAQSNAYTQAAPFNIKSDFNVRTNGSSYDTIFTANGAAAAGNPAVINGVLSVDLNATTIYFGYSPLSNSFFQGSIKTLTVDPGAFGRG